MPRWWNWYTHTVEGRGLLGMRVRLPPWAPNDKQSEGRDAREKEHFCSFVRSRKAESCREYLERQTSQGRKRLVNEDRRDE